jgi:hypothetical protein
MHNRAFFLILLFDDHLLHYYSSVDSGYVAEYSMFTEGAKTLFALSCDGQFPITKSPPQQVGARQVY